MTRRWVGLALVVLTAWSAPLAAELRVTSKTTCRKVAEAPPANDLMAAAAAVAGPMLEQMFGGDAGLETVVTAHEDGRIRIEYPGGVGTFFPAGTVVLGRPDGTAVAYDPKAGTWWKMGTGAGDPNVAAVMAQLNPEVSVTRTGESATIAGIRGEHLAVVLRMAMPLPPGMEQMPPEMAASFPSEIRLDAEMWQSAEYARYTKAVSAQWSTGPMAQFNIGKAASELQGLTLRGVVRMSMLAGYEVETIVTDVREVEAPAGTFDLPPGLKEVPMPRPQGPGR